MAPQQADWPAQGGASRAAPDASPVAGSRAGARDETRLERLDRNLGELNSELRVVVTGVQVLFAFLLIVPFNTGFKGIGPFERAVYFVALAFAALSAVCTIAPAAQHRLLFRHADKEHLVALSNRLVLVGMLSLAIAMCGCILLVATKLFGALAGSVTTVVAALPFITLWFATPLQRRRAIEARTDRRAERRADSRARLSGRESRAR